MDGQGTGRPELQAFAGTWRLARMIRGSDGQKTGTFEGRAVFMPEGVELRYEEVGTLRLSGAAVEAKQTLFWRKSGDRIVVTFSDGRAFHDFGAGAREAVHHDCPPDVYDGIYDFAAWPRWSLTWTVRGPRKAYTSETVFTR